MSDQNSKLDKKIKVILAIGNVGGGHKSAAQSLVSVFDQKYADHYETQIIDFFEHADPMPGGGSDQSYKYVSGRPWLLKIHEILWTMGNRFPGYQLSHRFILWRTERVYQKLIGELQPDLI